MKRLHVHVSVDDLAQSLQFYSTLFAAEPAVTKADYAKWMLDDPCVNFAISVRSGEVGRRNCTRLPPGVPHTGTAPQDFRGAADGESRCHGGQARAGCDRRERAGVSATQVLGRPAVPAMGVFERWLTLWLPVRRGAGNHDGRADRSAGDAVRGRHRAA